MSPRCHTTAPPKLHTLNTKPTWHNRAGRVDRSACFVLTVRQHWRGIPEGEWNYRLGLPPSGAWRLNNPRPAHDIHGLKGLCDRYAEVTFSARDLWLLHRHDPPYPLQGDFRTAKSNALRTGERAQWMRKDHILGDGPVNPNRGAGFKQYKRLGLPAEWQTTLRIERVVQHAKLRQHFFVCPLCSSRSTKLFLPLCTPREGEDALIAQLWLKSHLGNVTNPNRPLSADAAKLIERYGALFEPRQLRCRQCLGLRYGELKPSGNAYAGKLVPTIHRGVVQRLTDQDLFLSNLPKLLAKPSALAPLPAGEDTGEGSATGRVASGTKPSIGSAEPSPRPSPVGREGKTVDALSREEKERLYMLLAASPMVRRALGARIDSESP
ncbi:MAG: hypothetical protein AAGB26_03300 [Planctomycetota bacterium]